MAGTPTLNADYVGSEETTAGVTTTAAATTTGEMRMMMKSSKASAPDTTGNEEDAAARAARVLRTMETEVKYDAWLAEKPTGSPYAFVKQFGIAREAFLEAAEKLGVVFTEDELTALFGTSEVRE